MKKILLLATSALLLLAGCAKENLRGIEGEGVPTEVSFTAAIPEITTKAVADGDGAAASVNRCIMEIYYGGSLFTRMYSKVDAQKKASFTTQLVSNRTYTVAFWADCVADNATDDGIATDLYYTTDSDNGLKAVAIKGDYVGNNDARDAFAFCKDYTIAQAGSSYSATLTRPFAQINVITTDVATVAKVGALAPENVNLTIKNAVTSYNVLDSTAVSGATDNLTYTAAVYKWDDTKSECTLSMDYIFAETAKAVIDIDWKATKSNNADVSHAFANIPYQRNYRTNIKGALLTTTGQWNVTVDPVWESSKEGKEEYNVYCTNVSNGVDVEGAVNDKKGDSTKDGQGISVTIDQGLGTSSVNDDIIIPDNTPKEKTPEIILDFKTLAANAQIIIRDENHPRDAQEATSGAIEYTGEVVVIVPDGTTADQVKILTDKSTVTVRGQYGNVIASCAPQTIVVSAGSVICTLSVVKGNVALYGQVTSIERAEGNTSNITVNVYDGAVWGNWSTEKSISYIKPIVNLGTYTFDPTGYNVEGSTVFANTGSSPATWTVSVTDEWQYYAAKEFSNVSGTTITIMNAAELALFAKNIATLGDYSVILGADIDLSDHEWNPISSFSKTFDGNDRTISGMNITKGTDNLGLFGSISGATIQDLTISGASISGDLTGTYVGVLAGAAGISIINNVSVTGATVNTTMKYTGGIAGSSSSTIIGCSVKNSTIKGKDQVGAVVGYQWCNGVWDCTATGNTVTATEERAGGLVGKLQAASGNDNYFKMNNNVVSGSATAPDYAGGLIGQIMGDMSNYEIRNNSIDVTLSAPNTNPIGTLRTLGDGMTTTFTSALEANITGNTWTTTTLDADYFFYPASETGTATQFIWNGTPTIWIGYAADEYASTGEKTITIANAAQLALFAKEQIASSGTKYKDYTITLSNDINLIDHKWEPIIVAQGYDIVFDGGNKTISNLNVEVPSKSTSIHYLHAGLFSCFPTSSAKNLTIDGAKVVGYNHVAAIAGYGICAKFDNCHVKNATITSKCTYDGTTYDNGDKAGAICGYLSGESTAEVTNCTATNCNITAYRDLGSIVGYANGTASVTGNTASNCTVTVDNSVNYKSYTLNSQFDANEIVGEKSSAAIVSDNNSTNVTINRPFAE